MGKAHKPGETSKVNIAGNSFFGFQVHYQPVLLGALSLLFASVGLSVLALAMYRSTASCLKFRLLT